jgi:hypothetical protein
MVYPEPCFHIFELSVGDFTVQNGPKPRVEVLSIVSEYRKAV